MEIFQILKADSPATNAVPDFAVYSGPEFVPALDPDEFLYFHGDDGNVNGIYKIDSEPWKVVPEDEAANPINDVVTAYKKNRMWHVDNKDYRTVLGTDYASANYEIQDYGVGPEHPDGNALGNIVAPGRISITAPAAIATSSTGLHFQLGASVHLQEDKGFYGNLRGVFNPSEWERGVPYQVTGLKADQVENYAIVITREDHLGMQTFYQFLSAEAPEHVKNTIREQGTWMILMPSFVGFGYHSIELWHKNTHYTDDWTRIGGKEILGAALRFYSVPGSLGPDGGFPGVDLKESPGDGAYIYLEEYLDEKTGDWAEWRYNAGRYGKFQARTYVFDKGDTVTFEVQDSDPHLFAHRGREWYLSEKRQVKQLQETYLQDHIRHYVDVIRADDQTIEEDRNVDAKGSKITYTFDKVGKFQLKAGYRGVSKVAHRIVVVDPRERPASLKAGVVGRTLTNKEAEWLRSADMQLSPGQEVKWKLLTLQHLGSRYRYIDGPRFHWKVDQNNRFHPGNNFADSYHWRISKESGPNALFYAYDPGYAGDAPNGLAAALDNYDDADGWRPSVYVRHTSETPQPSDISDEAVSHFTTLSEAHKSKLRILLAGAPESWQLRLPWISFVKDWHAFRTDVFYSYRTRTNVKVIYDMNAFFSPTTGIFSGSPSNSIGEDTSPKHLREIGVHLHLMEDDLKLKRFFFQDLCTGRAIIVPADCAQAKAYNINDPSPDIVAIYPDFRGEIGVTVESDPGSHLYEPLNQPDYLWHYGSIAPVFTIDDHAGFGDLSAGDTVTLSGTMSLKETNHRDLWKDRLILAVGSGNAPANTTHAYASSFGLTGDGNSKVYSLGVAVVPLGGVNTQGHYPRIEIIDDGGKVSIAITKTRKSATIAWELAITLASTWKDFSTGDNPPQGGGQGHNNGRGVDRHRHAYTLKLDLDFDGSFETTHSGHFRTYQAEVIGLSFAVEQGEARHNPSGATEPYSDVSKWSAAARATNVWSIFTGSATTNQAAIYPSATPEVHTIAFNVADASHDIPATLFGTNIENIQTRDRYWGNYANDAELVRLMREMSVNWIRFPGGEPASTFHFDAIHNLILTTAQWGKDLWDTSKTDNTAAVDSEYVDFDEFKKVSVHTNATPFVGVNLESAYFFEALQYDELLKNPEYPVTVNKASFLANYSTSLIQEGLDQARQIANYLTSSTADSGLELDITHWYLDNESDISTYDNNQGIPGVAVHEDGAPPGVFASEEGRFNMQAAHYARMAADYMDVIDTATARSERQNKYIASWSNTKFMRDPGWKTILNEVGDRLSYIDFHTYWTVDGGSWTENLSHAPATGEPFPAYGVSSWEIWKKQLPMQWENQDDDPVDPWGGADQPVVWGEAVTQKLSYSEYFKKVRQVLDANNLGHVGIMMAEWGVAPRGHWKLDAEAYQVAVMFTEIFMQIIESGVVNYVATWPFASEPGWAVTHRANVINDPDTGSNRIQGTYGIQKQFAPFAGGEFVEIDTGRPDIIAIGSYKAIPAAVHVAILNKSPESRTIHINGNDHTFGHYTVNTMKPHDDPALDDDTYSSETPVFTQGNKQLIVSGTLPNVTLPPYGMAWIILEN